MKTDELISMLGTNLDPIKGGQLRNALLLALVIGAVTALCLMLATLGLPVSAPGGRHLGLKMTALAFALGVAAAGAGYLLKSARPGKPVRKPFLLIGLMFLAVVSAGVVALVLSGSAAWTEVTLEGPWATCLMCIPLFAVVPFSALIVALRRGAPTDLTRTGAIAGLVAGALAAAALAIHHPGASLPFIALWYAGPIALCALVGAILGPRLLRW